MRTFITSTLRKAHTALVDAAAITAALQDALNEYADELATARLPSARIIGCAAKAYIFFDTPTFIVTGDGVQVCGSPVIETFSSTGATVDVWVDCDVTVTVPCHVFFGATNGHVDSVALLIRHGDVAEIYAVVDGAPQRYVHLT